MSSQNILLDAESILHVNEEMMQSIVENMQIGRMNDSINHYVNLQKNLVALATELDNYPSDIFPYDELASFPDIFMPKNILEEMKSPEILNKPNQVAPLLEACKACADANQSCINTPNHKNQIELAKYCRMDCDHIEVPSKFNSNEIEEFYKVAQLLQKRQKENEADSKPKKNYRRWSDDEKYTVFMGIKMYGKSQVDKILDLLVDRGTYSLRSYLSKKLTKEEIRSAAQGIIPMEKPDDYEAPSAVLAYWKEHEAAEYAASAFPQQGRKAPGRAGVGSFTDLLHMASGLPQYSMQQMQPTYQSQQQIPIQSNQVIATPVGIYPPPASQQMQVMQAMQPSVQSSSSIGMASVVTDVEVTTTVPAIVPPVFASTAPVTMSAPAPTPMSAPFNIPISTSVSSSVTTLAPAPVPVPAPPPASASTPAVPGQDQEQMKRMMDALLQQQEAMKQRMEEQERLFKEQTEREKERAKQEAKKEAEREVERAKELAQELVRQEQKRNEELQMKMQMKEKEHQHQLQLEKQRRGGENNINGTVGSNSSPSNTKDKGNKSKKPAKAIKGQLKTSTNGRGAGNGTKGKTKSNKNTGATRGSKRKASGDNVGISTAFMGEDSDMLNMDLLLPPSTDTQGSGSGLQDMLNMGNMGDQSNLWDMGLMDLPSSNENSLLGLPKSK